MRTATHTRVERTCLSAADDEDSADVFALDSTAPPHDFAAAGVVVQIFDLADRPSMWDTCDPNDPALTWCASYADRISASVISKRVPYFYTESGWRMQGGLVLHADAVKAAMRCAWAFDAGSLGIACKGGGAAAGGDEGRMERRLDGGEEEASANPNEDAENILACSPGCKNRGERWCEDKAEEARGGCPWRSGLLGMMTEQEEQLAGRGRAYNELILDPPRWRATLPSGVEAVFSFGDDPASAEHAREVQKAFEAQYPEQGALPLLTLDTERGDAPFALVDS